MLCYRDKTFCPFYTVLPLPLIVLCLVIAWALYGCKSDLGDSMEIPCKPPEFVSTGWWAVHCTFDAEPFAEAGKPVPMQILYQPGKPKQKLKLLLHGYGGYPKACSDPRLSPEAGYITVANCSDPDNSVQSWWGPLGGVNRAGNRLAMSVQKVFELMPHAVDWGAGIAIAGTSMGGTGGILQSMILPENVRLWISSVQATVPHTMFLQDYYPRIAWAWGEFDSRLIDVEAAMARGDLDNVFYRVNGATNDNLGIVNLDFFRLCDRYRIGCAGTWHRGGHAATEPGVLLPPYTIGGPIRSDSVAPVFTESSANHWGVERGHYNLGIEWRYPLALRYRRHTNIGGGIPDQPESVMFDLTLRRLKLDGAVQWRMGEQTGAGIVRDGVLTINNLSLLSGDAYTDVEITYDD